jgi:hypothetical protein
VCSSDLRVFISILATVSLAFSSREMISPINLKVMPLGLIMTRVCSVMAAPCGKYEKQITPPRTAGDSLKNPGLP